MRSSATPSQKQLIEDLLDISRIIRGQVHLHACPTNLVQVISSWHTVQPPLMLK